MASDKKDRVQRKCPKCKGMLCCSEKDLEYGRTHKTSSHTTVVLKCNGCTHIEREQYKNLIG